MSGLSPLTMFQGNSREVMLSQSSSGKKIPKPKLLVTISSSLTRFGSYIKRHTRSRPKKAANHPAVIVEASPSPVAPDSSAIRPCTTSTGTGKIDSNVAMSHEVQYDIVESPIALTLSTGDILSTSSSTSKRAAIDSIPSELVRNIIDHLKPLDIICFGLTEKRMWAAARNHLATEGLYPARFVLTDTWGRYSARPTLYINLPELLETWMSPRVLFHHSSPRIFVENQTRANYLKLYFRMVVRELSKNYLPPTCLDLLEYYRPVWVLPECRGLFEQWVHMGVHDQKSCAFCIQRVRAMIPTRVQKSRISSHGSNLLSSVLQVIASTVNRHERT